MNPLGVVAHRNVTDGATLCSRILCQEVVGQQAVWMGILNVSPDSFSDGGDFTAVTQAIAWAQGLVDNGAHIIDVGAVSTRPGAPAVSPADEWARLEPVLPYLRQSLPPSVAMSLDSGSPLVAWKCAQAGWIDIINDVWGGTRYEYIDDKLVNQAQVASQFNLGYVIMHKKGEPATMQQAVECGSCLEEVIAFLRTQAKAAINNGVKFLAIDPGIGFGKSLAHNQEILSVQGMAALTELGFPVLIGLSRKRFLGELSGISVPRERDLISKHWEHQAIQRGARIIRSHRMPKEFAVEDTSSTQPRL